MIVLGVLGLTFDELTPDIGGIMSRHCTDVTMSTHSDAELKSKPSHSHTCEPQTIDYYAAAMLRSAKNDVHTVRTASVCERTSSVRGLLQPHAGCGPPVARQMVFLALGRAEPPEFNSLSSVKINHRTRSHHLLLILLILSHTSYQRHTAIKGQSNGFRCEWNTYKGANSLVLALEGWHGLALGLVERGVDNTTVVELDLVSGTLVLPRKRMLHPFVVQTVGEVLASVSSS